MLARFRRGAQMTLKAEHLLAFRVGAPFLGKFFAIQDHDLKIVGTAVTSVLFAVVLASEAPIATPIWKLDLKCPLKMGVTLLKRLHLHLKSGVEVALPPFRKRKHFFTPPYRKKSSRCS